MEELDITGPQTCHIRNHFSPQFVHNKPDVTALSPLSPHQQSLPHLLYTLRGPKPSLRLVSGHLQSPRIKSTSFEQFNVKLTFEFCCICGKF